MLALYACYLMINASASEIHNIDRCMKTPSLKVIIRSPYGYNFKPSFDFLIQIFELYETKL